MICPKCGANIRDGLTFCPKCGASIHIQQSFSTEQNFDTPQHPTHAYKPKKIYQKNWFIILMLIVFFPVGLFLMWKHSNWNIVIKIIISMFFAIMCIYSWLNPTDTVQPKTTTTATTHQEKNNKKILNTSYEFGFKNNTITEDNCTIKITNLKIVEDNNEYILDVHYDYTYTGSGEPHSALTDFSNYIMIAQGTYQNNGKNTYNELGTGRSPDFLKLYMNDVPNAKNETIKAVSSFTMSDLSTPITIIHKKEINSDEGESHTFNISNQTLTLAK